MEFGLGLSAKSLFGQLLEVSVIACLPEKAGAASKFIIFSQTFIAAATTVYSAAFLQ